MNTTIVILALAVIVMLILYKTIGKLVYWAYHRIVHGHVPESYPSWMTRKWSAFSGGGSAPGGGDGGGGDGGGDG